MLQSRCKAHTSEDLEFYCKDCRSLACRSCVLSPSHRSHSDKMIEIEEALKEAQTTLKQYISKANGLLQGAENLMDNSARSSQKLQENTKRAEAKIQKYFHRMRSILTDREHYFVSLLRKSVEEKKKKATERKSSFKVSMSGIIEGLKSLDELTKRESDDISVLRDQGAVFEKLDLHMDKMSRNIDSDFIDVDTSVTMPCFEDQNFEKVCRQVGDPGYRVSTQNFYGASPSVSVPLLSPITPSHSPPPVPPRIKSNSLNSSVDPRISPFLSPVASPTGSDFSDGDRTQGTFSPVPPPIPPKSPSHGKKKIPKWLKECKEQYDKEKSNGEATDYEVPFNKTKPRATENGPTIIAGIKENGMIKSPLPKPRSRSHHILSSDNVPIVNASPIPRTRTKFLKSLEYKEHTVTVEAPTPESPPLPLSLRSNSASPETSTPLQPLFEITSKMMLGPHESRDDKINPSAVSVGSNYVIIVIDKGHKTARMLKGTGKFLDYIGKEGPSEGILIQPTAVSTDITGNIYIVDKSPTASMPRILKYSQTGQFVCKLVPKGMRGGSILGDPQDIAVTHDGHVLVTDCEKSCIHVFDSTGKHEKCFGLPNELSSLSFRPSSIALDNRGRVIVTDGSAHVWMFTPDGNMLQHFGWEGQNPGDLYRPRGVAINNKDQIIVSEGGNHRISVFTSSGSFVKCLGTLGDGLGQFNGPAGVSAFQNGSKLVIADEENCRLQVYDKL